MPSEPVLLAASAEDRRRQINLQEEQTMPNYQDSRDDRRGWGRSGPQRDERGRFTDDDDRRYGRDESYGSRGRSGRDDDERRSSSRGDDDRGQGWYGDSEGHSEAARRGWESRGRESASRYDSERSSRSGRYDDDRRSSSGSDDRGRGWYGDSEGHSEAAQRGWENRGRESSSRYDDERRTSSRHDGDRMSSRDEDYRGNGRSGRNGDDDRGHGGWFGDSEGHSEASRRGWENRGRESSSRYDDERRTSSRQDDERRTSSRQDDDRGNGRSGRGRENDRDHGGWFGDSEGHAEAARRGWQGRRDDDDRGRRR
jgi:hypothetical protein